MTTKKGEGKTQLNKNKETQEKKLLFLLNESIPIGNTERKKYVSDISYFYASIFKDKLQHFIGLQLVELARVGQTELMTQTIRSNINCFRLIDEWMQKMSNEHVGNIEEIRNRFKDNESFINNLKETYGEN